MDANGARARAQRSIDDLEDRVREDPNGCRAEALARLGTPPEDAVEDEESWRLRMVLADVAVRSGDLETAATISRRGLAWAEGHSAYVAARAHRHLAIVFAKLGDGLISLEHAVAAVDGLDRTWRTSLRADHLLGLGHALSMVGSHASSIERFRQAARLVEPLPSLALRRTVANNLGFALCCAGQGEAAARESDRLRTLVADAGGLLGYEELDTIAAAYELVDRHDEAIALLEPASVGHGVDTDQSEYDGAALCLIRLVRLLRLRGRLDEAADVGTVVQEMDGVVDSVVLVDGRREIADLHADRGDFESAFALLRRYLVDHERLQSRERDGQARIVQAIFEAGEARRDSERFRELAERDALTGLHNRRYADSELPRLLAGCAERSENLTLALIDLDRFKSVNDNLSHAVGDEVLRQIGRLLSQHIEQVPAGVVARLGGEEFVTLLPGLDPVSAGRVLEALRLCIARHDWTPVTGHIPVTVSIGVAFTSEGVDNLMEVADRRLYAAKRAGRDRVVASDAEPSSAVSA